MIIYLDIRGVTVSTTSVGQAAEAAVAEFLKTQGYKILTRNWRTRVCEIDIVAKKEKAVYFVEVKYRSSLKQGDGFEYITPKKLQQMRFAAQVWSQQNNWDDDSRLLAAAVSDQDIRIVDLY
jgi:uncharacterized protein (TIGR00252 family)